MKVVKLLIFCIIIASCTKKSSELEQQDNKLLSPVPPAIDLKAVRKPQEFSKTLREAVYFSNSLEREALKLILKDSSLQKITLFSVLSYIFETNSGVKKSTPRGLDCGKYEIQRIQKDIRIFKTCVKPSVEIVQIHEIEADKEYQFDFLIKEWASVVGSAVALTGSDVKCIVAIKDKKLQRLNCENWSYQVSEDQMSSTVVKIKEFVFQRDAKNQFTIKGGFFKELSENKKINISVPLAGKIKIIEKEIEVIDEFAEKKTEVKNEKKEEFKKENINKEAGEEDQQQEQKGDSQIQFGNPQGEGQENQNQNEAQSQKISEDITQGELTPEQQVGYPQEQQSEQPINPPPEAGRGGRGR
ncbi:hypothetical protein K2P97_10845 [bacterium]|nr:hypothetical protein [bacterium]